MLEACIAESLLMTGVTVTSGEYCAASAIAKILYDPNYASTYSKNEKEKSLCLKKFVYHHTKYYNHQDFFFDVAYLFQGMSLFLSSFVLFVRMLMSFGYKRYLLAIFWLFYLTVKIVPF